MVGPSKILNKLESDKNSKSKKFLEHRENLNQFSLVKLKNVPLSEVRECYTKVEDFFFDFPNSQAGLNDLSESIASSKTSTKMAVETLVEEGFLKKEEIGKAWRISADPKHRYNLTRKVSRNLHRVYESGIIETVYSKIPNARVIILFGSYRWGADNEKSDIDIAVEVLDNQEMRIETLGVIETFGFRKNVKVNIHVFSRNKIDLNLFTNIANGIVLDGLLEVHP